MGDGNTDSPLWADAAFAASAIGISGPDDIVPHMAPGLAANAGVMAANAGVMAARGLAWCLAS